MKKSKVVIVGIIVMMFLSSCATLGKKKLPYFPVQGMVQPGTIVVSVDAQKEQALVAAAFGELDEFSKRAQRVSLAFTPTDDTYPLQPSSLAIHGVVEGDYPRFLLNTGMMYSRDLQQKSNADGLSWFRQKEGPLSLYTPRNDALIFTNGDYAAAYEQYASRLRLMDDETAFLMAQASLAVYAEEPETFFDLGLNLPQSVFKQAKRVLLLIHQVEGAYFVDAFITMEEAKQANTLSQMVRSGYLARLKKERIPYTLTALKQMFLLDEDLVTILQMPLSEEQMKMMTQSLTGIL